ncbi:hypothetical protein AB0I35_16080 [Nocardia sp. NPDC050378]|uniref:hypothetical protein n=1 Tax=Nocardia sp. NPDC050378 TaxID=3155400 RepID=UPI0033D5D545
MDEAQGAGPVTDWWAYAHRHPLRYRLAVLATDAREVVTHAGGWLFDRSMAGWDVNVVLADVTDLRPLQILGATVLELEGPLSVPVHHSWPDVLAVAPDLLRTDHRVHDGVLNCLDNDLVEVVLWGSVPTEFRRHVEGMSHRLTGAARAFKARALAATDGAIGPMSAIEGFHSNTASHAAARGAIGLPSAR